MDIWTTDRINSRLIEQLLSLPFPYSDILEKQINASRLTNTETHYIYTVHFQLVQHAPSFPAWLNVSPLSWQVCVDGIPVICHLFIGNHGYIESLEVVNMAFECIKWDRFFELPIVLDTNYDVQHIFDYLLSKELQLSKVQSYGTNIDIMLEDDEKKTVVSFLKCNPRMLNVSALPARTCFEIIDLQSKECKYSVYACNGKLDFDCEVILLQPHLTI